MKTLYYDNIQAVTQTLGEIYNKHVFNRLLDGKKDLIIVDLGGCGVTGEFFSNYGKVYVYQPAQKEFECLFQTAKDNPNIIPFKCAVSHKQALMQFFGETSLLKHDAPSVSIESITLKTVMLDNKLDKIDLLKVDVCGSEFDLLSHSTFDEVADKIDMIIGKIYPQTNRNPGQITQSLQERGFKVDLFNTSFIAYK